MPTLALRGGARVAVAAAEWENAFGVVIRGRVQLELRSGAPGPILECDAGFWLRGTGVRALRNPGRRTARIHIIDRRRNDMSSLDSIGVAARPRGLVITGLVAILAAVVATTAAAAIARAIGVTFEIPDGGAAIPLSGFAVVTGFFSIVGVVIAAAFQRWSTRPAARFGWTAGLLSAISLVPPLLVGGDFATVAALIVLHLIAAAVMIPSLTRALRAGNN